ncbi:non-ribosomal peptide synthetase [Nostoc sp. GT001]|uniref:non-ribosomal peptide synthetase n=1 Tax=Nostoc sp. GT001 TaxID=3056647 RepID=UPI0025AA7B7E|nr:non-ribosomal peptide synthetase [Nostoc sp. GT001]MDM9580254.1 amino acid adenylation domain-containing protein [Nostoc sp. GT001]
MRIKNSTEFQGNFPQKFHDCNPYQTLLIHHLFEAQVLCSSTSLAIEFEGKRLSYQELNQRANRLAHYLQVLGVQPDTIVGLCLERSLELVIAVLAILKAGGAYLPLDPSYPAERLSFMLENAQASILLTQSHLCKDLSIQTTHRFCLDSDEQAIAQNPTTAPQSEVTPDNLAYVIYTSGSTGKPKGVAMPHHPLVNLITWQWQNSTIGLNAKTLQYTPISFDVSFQEIFATLTTGGTLVLISEQTRRDPTSLLRFLNQAEIKRLFLPFVALQQLAEVAQMESIIPASLREVITAGEQLRITTAIAHLFSQLPQCSLYNHYGPSETHVVTAFALTGSSQDWPALPPIGQPIANSQIYLLDSDLQPVPVGVAGELYVGGVSLAKGYFNSPELTAQRFVVSPFNDCDRLYKTGDLARYLADGNIEYLGRIDQQLKIRGYRIEPGEIENVLEQHSPVRQAVVVPRNDIPGEQRLVAYIVVADAPATSVSELRQFLRSQLPEYMVPSTIVLLDKLPLTPSGKVDRQALPVPSYGNNEENFVAPETPTEIALANIWSEILGLTQVGIYDHFLDLGGHSLLATQVISRIRNALQIELPLHCLFESATIAELAKLIETDRQQIQTITLPPIQPVERDANLPLASVQEPLWFLDQLVPNNPFYNVPEAFHLSGLVNVGALEQSFQKIINRHEILRTTFKAVDGQPIQVIHPSPIFKLPVIDSPTDQSQIWELIIQEARRSFDLSKDLMLRAALFKLSETEHFLLINLHHIVCDGWSINLLLQELATLYTAFASKQTSPLSDLKIQYADFAVWQRQWLQGEIRERQLAYWQKQLNGLPPILPFPTDFPPPPVSTYQGARHFLSLSQSLSTELKELSRREGVTFFMILLAAFQTLLFHYTGQDDFAIGTLVANRHRPELEKMLGFFANTLVLRADLSGLPSFRQFLQRVREMTLGAYAHQYLPFEELVQALQPDRDLNQNPLVQVVFNLQNTPTSTWEVPGLSLTHLPLDNKTVKFDLFLELAEAPIGLVGYFEYSTDLFAASTIARMTEHFQKLLEDIVANPDEKVDRYSLLTKTEQQQLHTWNQTQKDFPQECIHQLFEAQVARIPNAIAIEFAGQQLTYRELNQQANQVANYLQTLGVKPDVIVGICIERSLQMMIGLLGIMKAGGVYVPLDPAYPQERLAFMLNDSQAPVLLTQQSLSDKLTKHHAQVVCIDSDWHIIGKQSQQNPNSGVKPENLVYTIYTSGSTGKPKGVQIKHCSLVNIVSFIAQEPGLSEQDILLAVTTISFDIATIELYLPLIVGARIAIASREVASDASQLAEYIERSGATFMQATPATWRMLLAVGWQGNPHLRILCGGEALSRALADELLNKCSSVWNVYGPTETTVWSTIYKLESGNNSVPIGSAIANTQIYLCKSHKNHQKSLQLVPVGVAGELYIGGVGLAQGYLNRPELNQERFIHNPFRRSRGAGEQGSRGEIFSSAPLHLCTPVASPVGDATRTSGQSRPTHSLPSASSDRLYKTGDLARYLPDGNIEYLGRIDHQVKIRGFRIELGDIETALNQHPTVRETVVVANDERLVAYLVPKPEKSAEDASTTSQIEQLQQWQTIWNESYNQSAIEQNSKFDPKFNITSWNSSYTGLAIASQEMQEWVDRTVERILSLQPQRVLEIGCGMGLLLFRIAPHCSYYLGMDLSETAICYLEQQLKQQNLSQVKLATKAADALDELEAESFDAIVINSVIQYFPSIDYLVSVLEKAVKLVKQGGYIFIGDVRSLPLLETFHTSVQLYQAADTLPIEELRQRIQERIAQDGELVIEPAFFNAVKQHLSQISHVQIQLKRGDYHNEMTCFRYDVILHIGTKENRTVEPTWVDWQPDLTLSTIHKLLEETEPEYLGLAGIQNPRVLADVEATKLLANSNDFQTVGELRAKLQENTQQVGIDPEALWNLGNCLPYTIHTNWSVSNVQDCYDVVFQRNCSAPTTDDKSIIYFFCNKTAPIKPWSAFANNPLKSKQADNSVNLISQLRAFLKEKLPDYMIPAVFVVMDSLPLTPNGKVDRRALPAPNRLRPELQKSFVAPRNEVEQQLAQIATQILGLQQVGIYDNFFELGGHSLLLARMLFQIQKTLQIELSLQNIFIAPSIAELAKIIAAIKAGDYAASSIHPALDLEADAILDPTINSQTASLDFAFKATNVLLTGATGFLGAFFLHELLEQTQAKVYCLVRASDLEEGNDRIKSILEGYKLWEQNRSSRIIPVIGDISLPLLGLSPEQFQNLAETIDIIYHNGASVNFVYPYSALKPANVLGTQEILRLASQTKIKPVHFVSTIGVFSPIAYPETAIILEQSADRPHGLYGYTQSKWVAEKLVTLAHERGIPTAIYRPTWIEGHSQTGICNRPGFLRSLIKGCIQLGLAPDWNMSVDIVPVDYISQAIIQLSRQKSLNQRIFHISNPQSISWNQLVNWMQNFGYSIEQISFQDWLSKVIFLLPNMSENALYPFFSFLFEKLQEHQQSIPEIYFQPKSLQFDSSNTFTGLVSSNITCPPVDDKLLNTYFSYFIHSGFLQPPLQ